MIGTELTWFVLGITFGLGFLLSLSAGYYIGKNKRERELEKD